jgi:hypothetical protein
MKIRVVVIGPFLARKRALILPTRQGQKALIDPLITQKLVRVMLNSPLPAGKCALTFITQ